MSPAPTPPPTPPLSTPAQLVAELPQEVFDDAARNMAQSLRKYNFVYLEFTPGDHTAYRILLARGARRNEYLLASNWGTLYPWAPGNAEFTAPDYCSEHFVADHSVWTGHVYARLLNTLRPLLAAV